MSGEIPVAAIENGSAFAFISLGVAFATGNPAVTDAHLRALIVHLRARDEAATRLYFSQNQKKVVYLPVLGGLGIYAALFAFAKALESEAFGAEAREELKRWVDGDAQSVAYTMIILKWGAESRTPSRAPKVTDTRELAPSKLPDLVALSNVAEALREHKASSAAFAMLKKVAKVDGRRFGTILPQLVDGLAGENRDRILEVLKLAIRNGLDVAEIIPVLGGLLLDRDYYDAETLGRLYGCLFEAAKAGCDLSSIWPFVPLAMPVDDKQLKLVRYGAERGLPIRPFLPMLAPYFKTPTSPDGKGDPERFSKEISCSALALEILAVGVGREELLDGDIEGVPR